MTAWTDDDLRAATARLAARVPGYRLPAAYGVGRRDGDALVLGHVNPPGAVRPLPAAALALACGHASGTAVVRLDAAGFAEAVALAAPAEAATHVPHPNLWSWRALLAGGRPDSTYLAFFVADPSDPVVDADDAAFRAAWGQTVPG